jgi:rhamnosyltransferase
VSIVVRCFNEERMIGRRRNGIAAQTRPPDEILIVDSGSTDRTVEIGTTCQS